MNTLTFYENDMAKTDIRTIGTLGEDYAALLFEQAGLEVLRTGTDRAKNGDLTVINKDTGEVKRIEVKTSRRNKSGHWQCCLKRQIKARVCTDVCHADFLLLLCLPRIGTPVPFLIPTELLTGMKQITITKNPLIYAGKWSYFRVRKSILERLWLSTRISDLCSL